MSETAKLYTFEQAIEAFFKDTGLMAGDLLAAYRKKRLRITKIGHKKFVTEAQVREMIERCQDKDVAHTSQSNGEAKPLGTPSATPPARSAQAALQAEINRIKGQPRKNASQSTSRKSTPSAENVVPLRSA